MVRSSVNRMDPVQMEKVLLQRQRNSSRRPTRGLLSSALEPKRSQNDRHLCKLKSMLPFRSYILSEIW